MGQYDFPEGGQPPSEFIGLQMKQAIANMGFFARPPQKAIFQQMGQHHLWILLPAIQRLDFLGDPVETARGRSAVVSHDVDKERVSYWPLSGIACTSRPTS
jgi:hypothetical protein